MFIPTRRGAFHHPPSHPGVILAMLVGSLVLTYWVRENGAYVFIVATVGILLGSAVGFFAFDWAPSWAQHVLAAAMISTSTYAWQQKSYFED